MLASYMMKGMAVQNRCAYRLIYGGCIRQQWNDKKKSTDSFMDPNSSEHANDHRSSLEADGSNSLLKLSMEMPFFFFPFFLV